MGTLNPSMRLKVKRDTFFVPDPNGGVYFRNNEGTFRMEGRTIHQWIEQLLPAFDGERTLAELTDGLPERYQDRVYEIAEVLYRNGFLRDVSQDRPHQLEDAVVQRYASQIEFLDHLVGSGAYHFQSYRQTKVLAVGAGQMFVSLISALFESGLPKVTVLIGNSAVTDRGRLAELAAHARTSDPDVALDEIVLSEPGVDAWCEAVRPFDAILYVSEQGDVEELRLLNTACRREQKLLIPALCVHQVGVAGPLVHPETDGCWESAWRRIHQSALHKDPQLHTLSSTTGAMLANVIVFELFKTITGVTGSTLQNQIFLLNLETLEGHWHSFLPHPLVTGCAALEPIQDVDSLLTQTLHRHDSNELLNYFSRLTSADTGIFHTWEEADLQQLPLAQCRIQVVDPLAEGPTETLTDVVCTGLTHEEARREAGLTGIEAYVSRLVSRIGFRFPSDCGVAGVAPEPHEYVGVGAGETAAEAIGRGLQKCLAEELRKHWTGQNPVVPVQLNRIEDARCQFYLRSLTTLQGAPQIGLGQPMSGFPVVWVGANGRWYGSVGLNITLALRQTLQDALQAASSQASAGTVPSLASSAVLLVDQIPHRLDIPACEETVQVQTVQSALQILKRNRKRLLVFNLAVEPFLQETLAGVFGVLLREEESR